MMRAPIPLAGTTAGMIGKLAAQAVCELDPEGSGKRRERAEREEARVRFWREHSGACALAAYGLPADAALAANANVARRAGGGGRRGWGPSRRLGLQDQQGRSRRTVPEVAQGQAADQ